MDIQTRLVHAGEERIDFDDSHFQTSTRPPLRAAA